MRRGPSITAAEAVMRDAYIRVLDGAAERVRTFEYVFEYDDRADGASQRLTVRGDGEVKVLDY